MNCKQGDLAIVIFALESSNIGKIVRVEQFVGDYACFENCWRVSGNVVTAMLKSKHGDRISPDEWLRPVSGLPLEEETEQKIKEPA